MKLPQRDDDKDEHDREPQGHPPHVPDDGGAGDRVERAGHVGVDADGAAVGVVGGEEGDEGVLHGQGGAVHLE